MSQHRAHSAHCVGFGLILLPFALTLRLESRYLLLRCRLLEQHPVRLDLTLARRSIAWCLVGGFDDAPADSPPHVLDTEFLCLHLSAPTPPCAAVGHVPLSAAPGQAC